MHIGIFETDHFEVTGAAIRLFDNGQNRITVFCYSTSWRQLQFMLKDDVHKYEWIVKPDNVSKRRFIRTIYKETLQQKIDLLLLNTITDNYILYVKMIRRLNNVRVIVTLHDINNFFQFKPAFNLRRWARYMGRRQLIRTVNEFNVIALTMVDYLKQKLSAGKKVHSLPGGLFDTAVITPITDPIQIVVPGTVDERRRNYDQVFELLEASEKVGLSITVVLLGGIDAVYGKHIFEKCREYENVTCYESSIVDQPEFDRVLSESHFVFTPSVIDTVLLDGVTETYGISISSGNLYDVVRHAKPWIIPAALTIPPEMQNSCIRYATVDDIVKALQIIAQDPDQYVLLSMRATDCSLEYTVDKVRSRNPSLFGQ